MNGVTYAMISGLAVLKLALLVINLDTQGPVHMEVQEQALQGIAHHIHISNTSF